MHSSTIPGANGEGNYVFQKHNFLSCLPLALRGAQTPTALRWQPTVRSAYHRRAMCGGDEAKALRGPERRLRTGTGGPAQAAVIHHSPAFAVTCSPTGPCQAPSPRVSLLFPRTGDKSVRQPCLAITPPKAVLRPRFGRQARRSNRLPPRQPAVAARDTSGKDPHLVIPMSAREFVRGERGSSLAIGKRKDASYK